MRNYFVYENKTHVFWLFSGWLFSSPKSLVNMDFTERDIIDKQSKASQQDVQMSDSSNEVEEEFLMHLKFDHGSYPLRHNLKKIEFLGVVDGNMFIQIGDSYFMGEYDTRNNSSIVFSYDKNQKTISDSNKCRSRIFMKRVLLKPKNKEQEQSQATS